MIISKANSGRLPEIKDLNLQIEIQTKTKMDTEQIVQGKKNQLWKAMYHGKSLQRGQV